MDPLPTSAPLHFRAYPWPLPDNKSVHSGPEAATKAAETPIPKWTRQKKVGLCERNGPWEGVCADSPHKLWDETGHSASTPTWRAAHTGPAAPHRRPARPRTPQAPPGSRFQTPCNSTLPPDRAPRPPRKPQVRKLNRLRITWGRAGKQPGQPSPAFRASSLRERGARAAAARQGRAETRPSGGRTPPGSKPSALTCDRVPEPSAPRVVPERPAARSPALRTRGGSSGGGGGSVGGDAGSARREATGAKPRGKRSSCAGGPEPSASVSPHGRSPPPPALRTHLSRFRPEPRVGGAPPRPLAALPAAPAAPGRAAPRESCALLPEQKKLRVPASPVASPSPSVVQSSEPTCWAHYLLRWLASPDPSPRLDFS